MAYGRVLLTENDRNMRTLLYDMLTEAGFIVTSTIESGLSADMISHRTADAAVISVQPSTDTGRRLLSSLDGIPEIPVIVLLSQENSSERVEYISLGADEVFIKPIDVEELVLQLHIMIRRDRSASLRSLPNPAVSDFGGIQVDMYSYTARIDGREIQLPPKEIEILHLLITNPNRVFRRGEIAAHVWGENLSNERTVDSHINRIKRLLGKDVGNRIVSVRGVGYKFEDKQ